MSRKQTKNSLAASEKRKRTTELMICDRKAGLTVEEIAQKHATKEESVAVRLSEAGFEDWERLYLYVSDDDYELPIAVADSPAVLGQMLGVEKQTVLSMISRKNKRYKKIWVLKDE